MAADKSQGTPDHYGAAYGRFDSHLHAEIRREAFGEDIGQNGWQTAEEQDIFIRWMGLSAGSRLLDFACGAGGPALRIVQLTGCEVDGLDIDARAIATANGFVAQRGLGERARFHVADGGGRLPFENETFDAVICIDAVNHILARTEMLAEWRRVLKPQGVAVFTNPAVITGPISGEELRIRSNIGAFLFTPAGSDEAMLEQGGFAVEQREDRTLNMGRSARGRLDAREKHGEELRRLEGDETFQRQQVFFETAARLAEERRLSRIAVMARKT